MARVDPAAMNKKLPNAETVYEITQADLPLSCPTPAMHLWNSHPRVYLPVAASGQAKCPYCGAVYKLVS